AWVLLTVGLLSAQRHFIYLPDRELTPTPSDVRVTTVDTADGVAHDVWIMPADGVAMARVVVFNGNAGNMGHRLALARNLAAEGMEVLLFDYRGYGDTGGTPSEEGLMRDATAVARIAFRTDLPVVFLGESLGAGPASALAVQAQPDAIVLRSPFTSLTDMARTHYPLVPTVLLRDRYPVEETVSRLEVPVLVILGTGDSIVPPELSRRVYRAVGAPRRLVEMEGLDHNDTELSAGEDLAQVIRSFVVEHSAP
ncbi:MAG: alpha/beta hydrolase, partial [Acidimicrobiia bacterium]